jgi:hypothetical protein
MQKWVERGNLSSKQYSAYNVILKNLIAKLMIENYMLTATKADNIGKNKLAAHYFALAKNMIIKEGLANTQKEDLVHIDEELVRLENEASGKFEPAANASAKDDDDDEWAAFKDNDDWKKKNIYD